MSHTHSGPQAMKSTQRARGLLLAVAALATVFGAQAQQSAANSSSTPDAMYNTMASTGNKYVSFNAGQSDYSLGSGAGGFASERRATAYILNIGGYFNNNFGVELGYTDFGRINRAGGSTKADGINLSLVGKLPMTDAFSLLGKVGTTYGRTEVSAAPASGVATGTESDFAWSYGVGAMYAFNPQWSALVQYDEHNLKFAGGDRNRISATTIGLRYRY